MISFMNRFTLGIANAPLRAFCDGHSCVNKQKPARSNLGSCFVVGYIKIAQSIVKKHVGAGRFDKSIEPLVEFIGLYVFFSTARGNVVRIPIP